MATPNEKIKTLQAFAQILKEQSELFTNIDINQLKNQLATHQKEPFKLIVALLAWCQEHDNINQALNIVINRCDMIPDNQPPIQDDPVLESQLIDNIMVILAKTANSQTSTNNSTNTDNSDNQQ